MRESQQLGHADFWERRDGEWVEHPGQLGCEAQALASWWKKMRG